MNIIINFKLFKNFDNLMEESKTVIISARNTKDNEIKLLVEKINPNSKTDDIIFIRGSTLCKGELPEMYFPKVRFCTVYFPPLFCLLISKCFH